MKTAILLLFLALPASSQVVKQNAAGGAASINGQPITPASVDASGNVDGETGTFGTTAKSTFSTAGSLTLGIGASLTVPGSSDGVGVAFKVNGSTLNVLNNGNVGIGLTAPTGSLVVIRRYDVGDTAPILRLGVDATGTTNFDFTRDAGTGALKIQGNQATAENISLAPTAGDVLIGTMTVKGYSHGLPQSQALCVTASQILGYCTSVVGASGGCTCVAP